MNLERLKAQLTIDEGVRLKVSKDTKGLPTVGVGHLVLPADKLRVGDVVSQERCDELFRYDLARTLANCERRLEGWAQFPDEVQEILGNMAFSLGVDGVLKFKTTLRCLREQRYNDAADALVKSLWYKQGGGRSRRIVERLRAL